MLLKTFPIKSLTKSYLRTFLGVLVGCLGGPSTVLAEAIITPTSTGYQQPYPQKIISLKPNITEILFDLGVGDRVIGVTSYCDRPAGAKNLPKVGDYITVNTERVLALDPDLVIGAKENSSRKEIDTLQRLGIKVELLPFDTLHDLTAGILKMGGLLGVAKRAGELASQIEQAIARIASAPQQPRPRVLVVLGQRPLIVAGGDNLFDESLQLLGATNVAGQSTIPYPHYSLEMLLTQNPDVILDFTMEDTGHNEFYSSLVALKAVQTGQVHRLPVDLLRPVPRITAGLQHIRSLILAAP